MSAGQHLQPLKVRERRVFFFFFLSRIFRIPSIGQILSSPDTSVLAIMALACLIAMQLVVTSAVAAIAGSSCLPQSLLMSIFTLATYVSLYIALIYPVWWLGIVPVLCMSGWCWGVIWVFRGFYYAHPVKRLYWASVVTSITYSVTAGLYVIFQAIPVSILSAKDVAIFILELALVLELFVFVLLLLFHCQRVYYLAQVERGYIIV